MSNSFRVLKPRGIRARLLAAFGGMQLAMLLAGALAGIGIWQLRAEHAMRVQQAQRLARVAQWTVLVQTNLERALHATRLDAAAGDDEVVRKRIEPLLSRLAQEMSEVAAASGKVQQQMAASAGDDPDLAARTAAVNERRSRFVALRAQIRDDLQMGEGAARVEAELVPAAKAMMDALRALEALLEERRAAADVAVRARAQAALLWLAGGLILAAAIGLALATATSRSVARPLADSAALARRIAAGDLSPAPDSSRADEIGELQRALAVMQRALAALVGDIHRIADTLRSASTEVASGSADLSQRTEQAASSLQQTAASIEELSGMVGQTAESARKATTLAGSAAEVARRGGDVVARVVTTMDEIDAGSRRIAEIIGVIDGIAFQTNILAQRSAGAAREIKALIGASVERVQAGARLVGSAGQTMQEIVGSVGQVAVTIAEIGRATAQQTQGIVEVNGAVAELDHMTQRNAALVEQSAASAQELREQAEKLAAAVARFRVAAQPS